MCSIEEAVLKIFVILSGKYLCWSLPLIDLQLQDLQFIKKRLQQGCFLVNIANLFLRKSANNCFCHSASYCYYLFLGAFSALNLIDPLQRSCERFKEFSRIRKKGKLAAMVTCCHSLSLVVPLVVICCHSLYHSLSLVVIRCTASLSFYK